MDEDGFGSESGVEESMKVLSDAVRDLTVRDKESLELKVIRLGNSVEAFRLVAMRE